MGEERRLVSLRRRVGAGREEAYGLIWEALAEAVTRGGGHAWRFASEVDAGLRLEFLEFRAAADPRHSGEVHALLERLDREIGEAAVEEWLEAR